MELKLINLSLIQKQKKNPSNKSFDLTEKIDFSEIYNLKNWIEVKKFSNQLFSKIN